MPPKVHLQGRVQDLDQACIPVTDHGFLFGDSVFETLRALGGRCAFLQSHLRRLRTSADQCLLRVPFSDEEIARAVAGTLAAAEEPDAAVRIVVTRGSGPLEPDPTRCAQPRLLVFARERKPLPEGVAGRGADLVVSSLSRSVPGSHAKTGNYLASVLALAEARAAGAFEAVILNGSGRVAECSGSNVFAVLDGTVVTPPASEGLLMGIARGNVLKLCERDGLPAREGELTPEALAGAGEAFLTSTLKEVVPIASLDGRRLRSSPGPVTLRLQAAYRALLLDETST